MAQVRPAPRRNVYEAPFWEYVQGRELRLQQCASCRHLWYPPGPVCPQCLDSSYDWVPTARRGRLLSWVRFHRQYFPEIPVPYDVVAAELHEGPILIANLVGDVERGSLVPGLHLELVFETVDTGEGEEMLLYQWAVAGEGR